MGPFSFAYQWRKPIRFDRSDRLSHLVLIDPVGLACVLANYYMEQVSGEELI